MVSDELLWFLANVRAIPGRVAKWHSAQIYVRVSIHSYDIEETCKWIAWIFAKCSCFWAASLGMTYQEFYDKSGYSKEGIKERASNYTAPISTKESFHWRKCRGISFPVPIDSISSNTEVNFIDKELHASLKNWRPQISSIMFKKLRIPELA